MKRGRQEPKKRKKVTEKEATDFFRRYNQGQIVNQRMGQAFLNYFMIECDHNSKECARKACKNTGAVYYNDSTRMMYCIGCARKINEHAGFSLCTEKIEPCLFHECNDGKAVKMIWESFVEA